MEQGRMTQREFEKLSKGFMNKLVGNFLYIHHEANPKWHHFYDIYGNEVMYGGDCTDVVVKIQKKYRGDAIERRLTSYMKELVGRHNEDLHEFGTKKFHGVTIELPPEINVRHSFIYNLEVTIHTGSGCCYDQDEIAYEVMAALSDVPVLKALAPKSCGSFVRQDSNNDQKWVTYLFEEQGIKVEFSHINDSTNLVVSKYKHRPREDWNKFKETMYDLFALIVPCFSDDSSSKEFVREYGYKQYPYQTHSLSQRQRSVNVQISSGSSLDFAIQIPYFSHIDFARLYFAKEIMERLTEVFKVEKKLRLLSCS